MINFKHTFLFCFLTCGSFAAIANVDGLPIGVLDTDLPKVSPYGADEAGVIKAAILINPESFKNIDDAKIVNIRFGLTSKINISEVTVWAAYSLDETPFMEYQVTQSLVKGWNDIDLPEGIACESRPFYIGYTLKADGTSYPVATVDAGYDYGFMFDNGNGWESHKAEVDGSLAISAKIAGKGLPVYDLGIMDVVSPRIMNNRTDNKITLEILNGGSSKVSGFSLVCKENNESDVTSQWDIPIEIESNRRATVEIDYLPQTSPSMTPIPFIFAIDKIKEGEDFNATNNQFAIDAPVSPYSFKRRTLVEEYTSEFCSNCPAAAELLHEAMSLEAYSDNVIAVCHHAGFQDDPFTQPCDKELIELFASSSTYNPAMSFDRLPLDRKAVISHAPGSLKDMQTVLDNCLLRDVNVDFEIEGKWNVADNKLNVEVKGMSFDGTIPTGANVITVYLLEDDVMPAKRQFGADDSFRHNHLIRAYNSTWGEPIDWTTDGKFAYAADFEVPAGVNIDNTYLVAFVSKYDAGNHFDCEIANAASTHSINWTGFTGINTTVNEEVGTDAIYYDLMGRRVKADTKGIVIKISYDSTGTGHATKIMN